MALTAKCLNFSYPLWEIVSDASTGQKSLKNENYALVKLTSKNKMLKSTMART